MPSEVFNSRSCASKAAASARAQKMRAPVNPSTPSPKLRADAVLTQSTKPMAETTDRVVAIGTDDQLSRLRDLVGTG